MIITPLGIVPSLAALGSKQPTNRSSYVVDPKLQARYDLISKLKKLGELDVSEEFLKFATDGAIANYLKTRNG